MTVYYVAEVICFADFEVEGQYERVSDYYQNEQDAIDYMKSHYSPERWQDSWGDIKIMSDEINIR